MALEAIRYDGKSLAILNQLLLPLQSVYERLQTVEDAWSAIRSMKVASLAQVTETDHVDFNLQVILPCLDMEVANDIIILPHQLKKLPQKVHIF